MKKLVSVLLLVCLLLSFFTGFANAAAVSNSSNVLASGYCGAENGGRNLRWVLTKDRTLIISGSGAMKNYSTSGDDSPFYMGIREVIVEEGVTSIGKWAFYVNVIEKVTLPDSVETIGARAFSYNKLHTVNLGIGLTSIGNLAFYGSVNGGGAPRIYYKGSEEQLHTVSNIKNAGFPSSSRIYFLNQGGDVDLTSLKVSGDGIMVVGQQQKLKVEVQPAYAINQKLTWGSSNESVATVDGNGMVTARAAGSAAIYAMWEKGEKYQQSQIVISVTDSSAKVASFTDLAYNFPHPTEQISIGAYQLVYGETKGTREYTFDTKKGTGGVCAGLVGSSLLFYNGIRSYSDYGATNIRGLKFDGNQKLKNFIWYMYLCQHLEPFQNALKDNEAKAYTVEDKYNIGQLAANATREPVYICIFNYKFGHALLSYGCDLNTTYNGQSCSKIWVYDCNFHSGDSGALNKFIVLYKNEVGTYTGEWDYTASEYEPAFNSNVWASKISYIPYSALIAAASSSNGFAQVSLDEEAMITILQGSESFKMENTAGQSMVVEAGVEQSNEIEGASYHEENYINSGTHRVNAQDGTYTISGDGTVSKTLIYSDSDAVEVSMAGGAACTFDVRNVMTESVSGDNYANIDHGEQMAEWSVSYMPANEAYGYAFDSITVSGEAAGKISTYEEGCCVYVSGDDAIAASAVVGNEEISVAAENLDPALTYCVSIANGAMQIICEDEAVTEASELPDRQKAILPDYDVESGAYEEGQLLTLTAPNELTAIYYTTDGTDPTPDYSTLYTSPIEIDKTMTVKVMATQYGCEPSDILELSYTMPDVAPPIANLGSGGYGEGELVELYHESGIEIYYTTDGSDPEVNGYRYCSPITLYEDTTLRAVAKENGVFGEEIVYEYQICSHEDRERTYAGNGDMTHLVSEFCGECGKHISTEDGECVDADSNRICDDCGAVIPIAIAGSNMTLRNELEVNFMFNKSDLTGEGYTAIITQTLADGTTRVTDVAQSDWGAMGSIYHKVSVRIAAKEMADPLAIEIVDADGNVYNHAYTSSVRDYAGRALAANSTTDYVRALMVDMLNYGAAAQNHFKYNASDLANNALTEEQQALATAKVDCTNKQVKDETVYGANLSLEDSILLNTYFMGLKGKDIASMYAMVTFADYQGINKEVRVEGSEFEAYGSSGDIYKIVVDDVVLADAKQLVTVTLYDADGTVYGTGIDSVESYVARAESNSTDTYGLYANIMKFATSAYNYLTDR